MRSAHIKNGILSLTLLLAGVQLAIAQQRVAVEPPHLTMARQLVANLDLQNTNYEHGAGTVQFNPPCVSRTDCSGFADALLRQCYGVTPEQFRQWLGSGRP